MKRGYSITRAYDISYFHDGFATGTFYVESVPTGTFLWVHTDYYKVYVDKNYNEVLRVEISYTEYRAMEAENKRLYGYWGWFGFVPGTLRKSPPVIRHIGPNEA